MLYTTQEVTLLRFSVACVPWRCSMKDNSSPNNTPVPPERNARSSSVFQTHVLLLNYRSMVSCVGVAPTEEPVKLLYRQPSPSTRLTTHEAPYESQADTSVSWCIREDLNLYIRRYMFLKHAWLPLHH